MKEKRLMLKKLREKDNEIKALKKIAQVSPPKPEPKATRT